MSCPHTIHLTGLVAHVVRAAITGSDWREQNALPAGGASAAARFDIDLARACVIELDPDRPAHLEPAGAVRCIGQGQPLSMPEVLEREVFTHVSMGANHVCALRSSGTVACWGTENGSQFEQITDAPHVALRSVCSGSFYSCGLIASPHDNHDQVLCWGESETVRAVHAGADGRRLLEVACGRFALCAVLADTLKVVPFHCAVSFVTQMYHLLYHLSRRCLADGHSV